MEIDTRTAESEYIGLMNRIGGAFSSEAGFENAQKYMKGLLDGTSRKNGWQMSEAAGESTPYRLQQFINRGRYDAEELQGIERGYVMENLGESEGTLVVDDTGFVKQGTKSCGVQRQYTGTAGKVCNCQVGVFLTYASERGHCPIDRRLYMPKPWMGDAARRKEAGVPKELEFATKPALGLEMIKSATGAGVQYQWVTGDCAIDWCELHVNGTDTVHIRYTYGDCETLRSWLEASGKSYVLNVSRKAEIGGTNVGAVLPWLPEDKWFEASCGDGSKGAKLYDWYARPLPGPVAPGFRRAMLVRRSRSDGEMKAYVAYAPVGTTDQKLAQVAGTRWTVETCFREAKNEVGLDQYEVRTYDGWHRHVTFALLAIALITVLSANSLDKKSLQQHDPVNSSLDEFKKKRNLPV